MNPTRGPHMNWFRLATTATLAGVLLAAGCASPCGCGGSRHSFFRSRGQCPCECCGNGGGGVPVYGASSIMSDGPILEPSPPAMGMGSMPPPALPPTGLGGLGAPGAAPGPLPPNLDAPLGTTFPSDPGRLIPNAAPQVPAGPSSRAR